jgi:hypothetical protein
MADAGKNFFNKIITGDEPWYWNTRETGYNM